jgi:mRNA interferase RelE/StbE
MYSLDFDAEPIEFLSKLPIEIRLRIMDKLRDAKPFPHHFFERLSGRRDYKLRVGDYRILADILDDEKKIQVTYIEHRKKVYKKK